MARPGDVIESPVLGERAVFRKTAGDTHGELLQLEAIAKPGTSGPVEHIHLRQEERIEVISGVMHARVAGHEQRVEAGQSVVIPAGTPHTFHNAGQEDLHMSVEFRPALQTERFFETMFGLARAGKTNAAGEPPFLQMAVMCQAHDIYLPKPPVFMQRLLFAVLVPIAKLLGYRAWYPEYSASAEQVPLVPAKR